MDNLNKALARLFIVLLVGGLGTIAYLISTPRVTTSPWIQVPKSTTYFLPIDLSDGTRCVALKVDDQVAITCNWSTTPNQ